MKKGNLLALAIVTLVGSLCPAEKLPPVEQFFRNPEFSQFKISPDGRSLAMLAPFEGVMNLYTYDLETREPTVLTGEKLDVSWFTWGNNERILYNMNQFSFDTYSRRYSGGLFAINKDGKDHDCLVEPFVSRGKGVSVNYIHRLPEEEDLVLVTNNQRRRERPDVFKMNIYTGGLHKEFNNPARINNFYVDDCGQPRFGISFNEEAVMSQYYSPAGSDEWIQTVKDAEDFEMVSPVAIPCDSDTGFVSSNAGRDKRALFRMNFATSERSEKAFLEDEDHDVNASAIDAYGGMGLVGFRYEAEKPVQIFYEETHKQLQDIIDKALPNAYNVVTSSSEDGSRLVIESISNKRPPEYYLLHMDGLRMEPLAKTMPWLDDYELCGGEPIVYEARDGRKIHGYLTLPKSYEPGKPVPLIVNPHGGPWARDTWGVRWWYDLEKEFFASRGFAVLQTNFRGSTGYGKDHLKSSFKNMEAMHHDVMDGVLWAIKEGYADPDKVGIAGASWGGYATMTALVKNPEMFRFGINIFGVVDLVEHINTYREWDRDEGYEYWLKRIGDPSNPVDRENLEDWSAINFLERIDDPVFIYHGVRDFNVDVEQSRMLASKLKSLDKPYELVIRTDEAHSAFDEENRLDLYRQIDAFLAKITASW